MAKKSHNVASEMKAIEEFLSMVLYYAVAVKRTSSQLWLKGSSVVLL